MTKLEKCLLSRYVLQGKSFEEIRRRVNCTDSTIKNYMKIFKRSGKNEKLKN